MQQIRTRIIEVSEILILGGLLALLVYTNSFLPFGRDQGNYAVAAWAWMSGSALYQDVLVFKPPATVWVHAVSQIFFGHEMSSIRWMDGIIHFINLLCIYALVRRWCDGRSGWAFGAGCAYIALYYGFEDWHGAQTDLWLNTGILAAMVGLTWRKERWIWGLAGAAVGVSFWLKFTYLAAGLPLILIGWKTDKREVLERVVLMGTGFVVFTTLVLMSLRLGGGLEAFFEHITTTLPAYAASDRGVTWGFRRGFNVGFLLRPLKWMSLAVVILTVVVGWRRGGKDLVRLLPAYALLFVGFLSCYTQGRFFPYHYGPLIAPVSLLVPILVDRLVDDERLGRLAGILFLVVVVLWNVGTTAFRAQIVSGSLSKEKFWSSPRFQEKDHNLSDQLEVAEWARQNLKYDETLFVWGFEPTINFVSRRRNPTPYIYNFPFYYDRTSSAVGPLLDDLEETQPDAFVIGSGDAMPWVTGSDLDSSKLIGEIPPLLEFVQSHYREEARIGRYLVLVRQEQ